VVLCTALDMCHAVNIDRTGESGVWPSEVTG